MIRKIDKGYRLDLQFSRSSARIRKIFPNLKLANQYEAKLRAEYLTGKFVPEVKRDNTLFENFAEEWLNLHAKPNLSGHYESKLKMIVGYFAGRKLRHITSKNIEEFKASLIGKVKPSSINRYLTIVKSIFSKAVEWQKLKVSPAAKVKKMREDNQRTRYLTDEEIKRLFLSANAKISEFLTFALNTGMRRSNLVNLQWEDLDFKQSVIHVLKTKSGKAYEIPINPDLMDLLKRKYHKNVTGRVLDTTNLRKEFENTVKKSGIKDFKLHDLRHTYASYLAMKGVDLYTIAQLLGHSDIKMTQRYAHLSPNHKQMAVNLLNFSRKIGRHLVDKGDIISSKNRAINGPS